MLLAADTYAFDSFKDNAGMVAMAVIVLVTWLAFRKMLELSERKKKGDGAPKP